MLVSYKTIVGRAEEVFQRWFDLHEDTNPFIALFLLNQYVPQASTEIKFINLVNAIERYHRVRFSDDVYMDTEKYREGLYQVLYKAVDQYEPQLDKPFKDSLKLGKLKYANEISLLKRLTCIVKEAQKNLNFSLFPNSKCRNIFIEKVKNARNRYVHYSDEGKENELRGREFVTVFGMLQLIVETCVLAEFRLFCR